MSVSRKVTCASPPEGVVPQEFRCPHPPCDGQYKIPAVRDVAVAGPFAGERGSTSAQDPAGVLPGPARARRRRRQWRHPTPFRLNALMIDAWLGFAVGLFVVVGTLSSVVGTLVVPRGINSRISRTVYRALDAGFLQLTRFVQSFERRDRILAWQAPLSLLVRLAIWLGLLVAGFALLLLPSLNGRLGPAFSDAGSSLFTLGYAAPAGSGSTTLEYLAAFTGLVVIGLQVGYLPTLYAAFNQRETLVSLLSSRAGVPAWGPEILARTLWASTTATPAPFSRSCSPHGNSGPPRLPNPTPPI